MLDSNTLKIIYSAIVLPHFDYCALAWDNCSQTLKNKLEKFQNKAARITTSDNYEIRSDCQIQTWLANFTGKKR